MEVAIEIVVESRLSRSREAKEQLRNHIRERNDRLERKRRKEQEFRRDLTAQPLPSSSWTRSRTGWWRTSWRSWTLQ